MSAANTRPEGFIPGHELHCAEPVIFVLRVRFNVVLLVHTFRLVQFRFSKICRRDSQYELLAQCLDPALISAARTTDYATVVLPLPGISNDLEVVRVF